MDKYGTAGQTTDDSIIRRMRIACLITKTTDTHPEHVILQQWLQERVSMLRYTRTYIGRIVSCEYRVKSIIYIYIYI